MADIQYLNYGDLQIELLALLNNLANQVQDYVNKQSWSNKRKEKFMSAYSDLMNRGILGASNNTGLWVLNVGGDDPVPLDTMSRKDKEMYQEAAYFIQQQMSALPTKASQEEEPEELKLFDASEFKKGFETHVNKTMSNGFPLQIGGTEDQWNYLDERNSEGLRGRTKRAEQLAKLLKGYSDSIDFNKYKFDETSPFKDADDFKGRIDAAVKALTETPDDINDDTQTLNALGIKASDWFNNGSGDPSGKSIILSDGTQKELSYGELAEYNKLKTELELKLKLLETAAKLAKLRANQYTNFRFFGNKLNGKPLSPDKSKDGLNYLNGLALKANLTGDEQSEIVGAFKLAAKNNILLNLSKEELSRFGPRWQNNPTRLKKINGLNGLYWDSVGQRVVLPYNLTNAPQTNFQDILDLNSPEALREKQNKEAEIGMNTAFKDIKEFSPLMQKELEALAWDAASIINPEAFSGSAMALNAARLRGEANPNRSTLDTILDYGTASLGGIQGVGDLLVTGKLGYRLYKLGKSMGNFSKFAGLLGSVFALHGVPDAANSVKKLFTEGPTSMSPQDLENIAYGFMAMLGVKSFTSARNRQTIAKASNPTVTEHNVSIKDKNGQSHEVKIDSETAKQILQKRTFGKKKTEVDSEILNMPKIRESILKYNESNPTKKLEIEGASIQNSSKFGRTGKNKIVKSKDVVDPNASLYEPIGKGLWVMPGHVNSWTRKIWSLPQLQPSGKGIMGRIKDFWNPEPKPIEAPKNNLQKSSTLLQNSNQLNINQLNTTIPHSKNEIRKEYRNVIEKELFSNNPLLSGEYRFENKVNPDLGLYFHVNRNNDGSGVLNFTNNINNTTIPIKFRTQKELQERIATFIKDIRTKSNNSTKKAGINHKEMGKILLDLKKKGWLKQGGTIDKQRIQQYKNFINK